MPCGYLWGLRMAESRGTEVERSVGMGAADADNSPANLDANVHGVAMDSAGLKQQKANGTAVDIESDGQRVLKAAPVSPAEKAYIEAFGKKTEPQTDKGASILEAKLQHVPSSPKGFTIKAVQEHDDRYGKRSNSGLSGESAVACLGWLCFGRSHRSPSSSAYCLPDCWMNHEQYAHSSVWFQLDID